MPILTDNPAATALALLIDKVDDVTAAALALEKQLDKIKRGKRPDAPIESCVGELDAAVSAYADARALWTDAAGVDIEPLHVV